MTSLQIHSKVLLDSKTDSLFDNNFDNNGLIRLHIYQRSQRSALRRDPPSSFSSNFDNPRSLLIPAPFLLSMPAVKKQRSMSQEIEPISHTMRGDSTSTTPYRIKYITQIFTVEYWVRLADRICENYQSVSRLFCYDWFSFTKLDPFLACSSPSSLRHRSSGRRKQKTADMMLQPSSSMMMRVTRMMRIVITSEGWMWQFLQRKVRESCQSIFDRLRRRMSLDGSCRSCSMIGSQLINQTYYNTMNFTYESYVAQMNSVYLSVRNWPTPYYYKAWRDQLSTQEQALALDPAYYTQVYIYAMQEVPAPYLQQKTKISRGEKRRQKRRQLQKQLESETKEIGSWVKLERKDLIDGIQKIKKKEENIKKKKQEKLSHLIQIHKQVYKHYSKKQTSVHHQINRRVNSGKSKKRISQIKKMKEALQKRKSRLIGKSQKQQDWQSQQQSQPEIQQSNPVPKPKKKKVQCRQIVYSHFGKLTGTVYNNMVLRQWVSNCPSQALDDIVLKLVNRLAYKQAIRKVQRPDKAKKIIVSGIKQCKRTLTTIIDKKKAKLLIVALNIQRNPYKGGVDDQVQSTIQFAQNIKIPIIHASNRSNIGRAFTGKFGPRVTMISIINYEGYQDMVEEMLQLWQAACQKYNQIP